MKAYKAISDNSLRLFRAELNMQRLQNSMNRLHMPGADFDGDELIKCIAGLVKSTSIGYPRVKDTHFTSEPM